MLYSYLVSMGVTEKNKKKNIEVIVAQGLH